jgi:hypothetical protein
MTVTDEEPNALTAWHGFMRVLMTIFAAGVYLFLGYWLVRIAWTLLRAWRQ